MLLKNCSSAEYDTDYCFKTVKYRNSPSDFGVGIVAKWFILELPKLEVEWQKTTFSVSDVFYGFLIFICHSVELGWQINHWWVSSRKPKLLNQKQINNTSFYRWLIENKASMKWRFRFKKNHCDIIQKTKHAEEVMLNLSLLVESYPYTHAE